MSLWHGNPDLKPVIVAYRSYCGDFVLTCSCSAALGVHPRWMDDIIRIRTRTFCWLWNSFLETAIGKVPRLNSLRKLDLLSGTYRGWWHLVIISVNVGICGRTMMVNHYIASLLTIINHGWVDHGWYQPLSTRLGSYGLGAVCVAIVALDVACCCAAKESQERVAPIDMREDPGRSEDDWATVLVQPSQVGS